MERTFFGSGPGTQTPDGCSVELYRQLPYMDELEDVLPLLRPGASVLELGCGTGRLCARLAAAGLFVTGVDESAAMLSHLPPAVVAACSSIESLSLARSYDAVVLASHLINHGSSVARQAFVRCARRHLHPGGLFLVQRHDPAWLRTAQPGLAGNAGGLEIHVEAVEHDGEHVHMNLRYQRADRTWRQSFSAVALTEVQVEEQLRGENFTQFRWHGARKLWVSAVAG